MEHPHRNRVLVVDDERLMRWSLTEVLHDHGCDVVEAADARDAQAVLDRDVSPDVVLLDLDLPDSTTLDLLSAIRERMPASRVVLMSGDVTPDIDRDARQRGAYDVLSKPFEMSTLLSVVDRAITGLHTEPSQPLRSRR
jgi:DNA-binding NtrC family response regulator